MARWWRSGRAPRGVLVIPRALTLGCYVDALLAAGVDDGEGWDAQRAPASSCLGVLNALSERADLPGGDAFLPALREQAAEAWGRLVAERDAGLRDGERLRRAVEEGYQEAWLENNPPGPVALVRNLALMPPTERAAALDEPLRRSLAVVGVTGIAAQIEKGRRDMEERTANYRFN